MSKAKGGRSGAGLSAEQAENSQVKTEVSRTESRKPARPNRVPMVAGLKLTIENKDPKYHYAWIQDRDGKIAQALAAYYEFVMENGEKLTRASGAFPLFAMRLEMRYWEEDQRLKHERAVGTLRKEQELAPDEYVPGAEDGRKHVLEREADYDPLA